MWRTLMEKSVFPALIALLFAVVYWLTAGQFEEFKWLLIPVGVAFATYFLALALAWQGPLPVRDSLFPVSLIAMGAGILSVVVGMIMAFMPFGGAVLAFQAGLTVVAAGLATLVGDILGGY